MAIKVFEEKNKKDIYLMLKPDVIGEDDEFEVVTLVACDSNGKPFFGGEILSVTESGVIRFNVTSKTIGLPLDENDKIVILE